MSTLREELERVRNELRDWFGHRDSLIAPLDAILAPGGPLERLERDARLGRQCRRAFFNPDAARQEKP